MMKFPTEWTKKNVTNYPEQWGFMTHICKIMAYNGIIQYEWNINGPIVGCE